MQGINEKAQAQLEHALDVLQHYHCEHTADVITRFNSPDDDGAVVYVTADPEWKRKLDEFTSEAFPNSPPEIAFGKDDPYEM